MTAAAFLDRDGVINELVRRESGVKESPLDPGRVALIDGAAAAIRRLRSAGYLIVGVSNQPAAAKGTIAIEQLEGIQARVLELLERAGAAPDSFRLCFHHPQGVVPELARVCDCRKPAPGMLLDAAADLGLDLGASWMIGDTDADVVAGMAAGCRTILIENPDSAHKRSGNLRPDATVRDLEAAAEFIAVTRAR